MAWNLGTLSDGDDAAPARKVAPGKGPDTVVRVGHDTPEVGPDGSVRRNGALIGAWFTAHDPDHPAGVAIVAHRTPGGAAMAVRQGLSRYPDPDVAGMVRRIVANEAVHVLDARPERVRFPHVVGMLGAVARGETHWSGHPAYPGRPGERRYGHVGARARPVVPGPGAAACGAFLATLDPLAIDLAATRAVPNAALDHWEGLDGTFVAGAPLRAALSRLPAFADILVQAWASDRGGFTVDMSYDDPDAILRRALLAKGFPRWLATSAPDGAADLPRRHAGKVGHLRHVVSSPDPHRPGKADLRASPLASGFDPEPAVLLLADLAALPADRVPSGTGWAAFARAGFVVSMVRERTGPEGLDAALNVQGADWEGWLASMAATAAKGRPADDVDLNVTFRDIDDYVSAFARQVVGPALSLSGGKVGSRMAKGLAASALLSGRSARTWLADSVEWHRRRTRIEADLAELPGVRSADREWGACMPAFSALGLSIRPLVTQRALSDEGRDGPDADGVQGLDHCVGGYAPECMRGESRIMGIVRTGPDGKVTRVSTVEFTFSEGPPPRIREVAQHLGRRNGPPGQAAELFLEAYERHLDANPNLVRDVDLEPTSDADVEDPGYDARVQGNWERAMAAWSSCMPRALRRLGPGDFRDMLDAAAVTSGRHGPARTWSPTVLVPPRPRVTVAEAPAASAMMRA